MRQKYFNTFQKLIKKINSSFIIENKPYYIMDYAGYNKDINDNDQFWIFKHYFPGIIRININKKSRYINNVINRIRDILEYHTNYFLLINNEKYNEPILYKSLTKEHIKDIDDKLGLDNFKDKLRENNANNIVEFIDELIDKK